MPSAAPDLIEDTEPSGLLGTLREIPLTDLLQSFELSRRTALVLLHPKDGPAGEVFVELGRVIYAKAGGLLGEAAFFAMAHCRRGSFRVRFHDVAPGRNIDRPTAYLVLEAHRQLDEASRAGGENPALAPGEGADPVGPDALEGSLLPSEAPPELPFGTGVAALEADVGLTSRLESTHFTPPPVAPSPLEDLLSELDDDAPTATDRPQPVWTSAAERRNDVRASDHEQTVTSRPSGAGTMTASLFSHFFAEASDEDCPAEALYAERTNVLASRGTPSCSSDESRTGA